MPVIRCPRCHARVRLIDGKIRPHHVPDVDKLWVALGDNSASTDAMLGYWEMCRLSGAKAKIVK